MNTLQNSTSLEAQYKSVGSSTVQKTSLPVNGFGEVSATASNAQVTSSTKSQTATLGLEQAGANKSKVLPEKVPNQKELDRLNKQLAELNNYIQFKRDKSSGTDVFLLVDATTQKVIKQYPSEEMLHMSRRLTEYLDQVQNVQSGQQKTGNLGKIISQAV